MLRSVTVFFTPIPPTLERQRAANAAAEAAYHAAIDGGMGHDAACDAAAEAVRAIEPGCECDCEPESWLDDATRAHLAAWCGRWAQPDDEFRILAFLDSVSEDHARVLLDHGWAYTLTRAELNGF